MTDTITEQTVSPREIDDAIRRWADTRARVQEMKTELKALEDDLGGRETFITQAMENLDMETRRVDNITVRMKKQAQGGRVSYKEGFLALYNKVNGRMQVIADDLLESTRGDKWIKISLVIESRKNLDEGVMRKLINAVKEFMQSFIDKIRGVSSDIDDLERMEKEQTEAELINKADMLIELAMKDSNA